MVIHKNIVVPKHYRVFYSEEVNSSQKKTWILFHGYGQDCFEMISDFTELFGDKAFFVAPEGGSRFYQKGIQGKVGASWMTSEDRLKEMEDYINYLNEVFSQHHNTPLNIFAFSQGCNTASRWLSQYQGKIDLNIFWGGIPAQELIDNGLINSIGPLVHFFGDKDQFLPPKLQDRYIRELGKQKEMATFTSYKGDHFYTKNNLKTCLTNFFK